MANILKDGKTYAIPQGLGTSAAYMVIDRINFDKVGGRVLVDVSIWASKDFKASENAALRTNTYLIQQEMAFSVTDLMPYFFVTDPDGATKTVRDLMLIHTYLALTGLRPDIPGVNWDDWTSDIAGGLPQTLIHK